jgi:hypothetical protein
MLLRDALKLRPDIDVVSFGRHMTSRNFHTDQRQKGLVLFVTKNGGIRVRLLDKGTGVETGEEAWAPYHFVSNVEEWTPQIKPQPPKLTQPPDPYLKTIPPEPLRFGTLYENETDRFPTGYVQFANLRSQIKFLHTMWSLAIRNKESTLMISPATFDPKIGERYRAYDNILSCRNIWLDFENGELRPERIPQLFPHVKMVIFNSYNHSRDFPRFRVVMFTATPLAAPEYGTICDMIKDHLAENGYKHTRYQERYFRYDKECYTNRSGLDLSKCAPTSLFNLPAQAARPEESFFKCYYFQRETINVSDWIKNYRPVMRPSKPSPKTQAPNGFDASRADRATQVFRREAKNAKTGNALVFDLACEYDNAGMPLPDIDQNLRAELIHVPAKHRRARERQVDDIIDRFRQRRSQLADI